MVVRQVVRVELVGGSRDGDSLAYDLEDLPPSIHFQFRRRYSMADSGEIECSFDDVQPEEYRKSRRPHRFDIIAVTFPGRPEESKAWREWAMTCHPIYYELEGQ